MKLLCIESEPIKNARGGLSMNRTNRVIEGKTYTGLNRRIDGDGDDVWYIEEVGADKQALRFLICSDEVEVESEASLAHNVFWLCVGKGLEALNFKLIKND